MISTVPPPRQFSLSAKSLAGLGLQPNPKTDRNDFWTCFWNVENLFAPETAVKLGRGPLTKDECTAKLRRIAQVLNQAAAGEAPDLIAFAEIQSERLLGELEKLLSQRYHQLFQDPREVSATGLAILARKDLFNPPVMLRGHDKDLPRPRAMLALTNFRDTPFLVAVNHWKSRMGSPTTTEQDRVETASWLGAQIKKWPSKTPVIVLGDFNAEPFERPLSSTELRGVRFRHQVLGRHWRSRLYNTAWSFLSHREGCPPTSYAPDPNAPANPVIFDQLLVSGTLVDGQGSLQLEEPTVGFFACRDNATEHNGVLQPARWNGAALTGASDHFPLIARFKAKEPST
ncbi:MAG: endonuclease/exonuclease/phosphatase family protein [Polyangiaceae bacterium]|nr:endonuclease/exonuclease/phosphatase family protein [Polyangiaceae bacterium]